jgi:tetratricopeptide (TPR) repeat protein
VDNDIQSIETDEQNRQELEEEEDNTHCKGCGTDVIEPGYEIPLCASCRTELAHYPVPPLIVLMGIVATLLVLMGCFKFPKVLNAAVYEERGAFLERHQRYGDAARQYREVLRLCPDCTDDIIHYGVDAYKFGDYNASLDALDKLNGRDVDDDEKKEADKLESDLQDKINAVKGESK